MRIHKCLNFEYSSKSGATATVGSRATAEILTTAGTQKIEKKPKTATAPTIARTPGMLRTLSEATAKMPATGQGILVGSRVGNFRQKNNSAEDGIDGTNGFFRRNSGCSAEQKISEFRSEPFRGRENNSEFRFEETKLEALLECRSERYIVTYLTSNL